MTTLITHPLPALALGLAQGSRVMPPHPLWLGAIARRHVRLPPRHRLSECLWLSWHQPFPAVCPAARSTGHTGLSRLALSATEHSALGQCRDRIEQQLPAKRNMTLDKERLV